MYEQQVRLATVDSIGKIVVAIQIGTDSIEGFK